MKHSTGVVLGVTRVNDERPIHFPGKGYLGGECRSLCVARRVVVVIIETALSDGDGAGIHELFDGRDVTGRVEIGRVVGMHAGGEENESGVRVSDSGGCGGGAQRFADADDALRARFAGAPDYRVAVAFEGRVREVGVAVDEDDLPSVRRGHFRSIHRRTGAAT